MRITKAEAEIILGAIQVEIESQHWRAQMRARYEHPIPPRVEEGLRAEDAERKAKLQAVAAKLKRG